MKISPKTTWPYVPLLVAILILAASGCGSSGTKGSGGQGGTSGCASGTNGCICYGNGTCNSGLDCSASGVCVSASGGAGGGNGGTGASGGVGAGGTTSTGGTSPTGAGGSTSTGTGGATGTGGGAGGATGTGGTVAGTGGAAGSGVGATTIVSEPTDLITEFEVDTSNIYYVAGRTSLKSVPKIGGATPTVLATAAAPIDDVAFDSTQVVYIEENPAVTSGFGRFLKSYTKTGGSLHTLMQADYADTILAVAETDAYWIARSNPADDTTGMLYAVFTPGGLSPTGVSSANGIDDSAARAGFVVVPINSQKSEIIYVDLLAPSAWITIWNEQTQLSTQISVSFNNQPSLLAADSTYVYWNESTTLNRATKTAGAKPTQIATLPDGIRTSMRADTQNLYFVSTSPTSGTNADVMSVPLAGGTPVVVAPAAGDQYGQLRLDGNYIYVVHTVGSSSSIVRLSK